jgi:hypothetical protein
MQDFGMVQPTASILHQDTIRRLSGDGAFERGKAYAAQGRVTDIVRKEGAVTAKVRGSEPYAVRIWMHEGSLAYACNCPQGQEQAFCKHAVALALTFVGGSGFTPPAPPVEEAPHLEAPRSEPPVRAVSKELSVARAEPRARPELAKVARTEVGAAVVASPAATATPAVVAAPAAVVASASPAVSPSPSPSIAVALRNLSHAELVLLVLEEALDNEAFRQRVHARLVKP